MNSKRYKKWGKIRKLGKQKYVILFSVGTGFLIIILWSLVKYLLHYFRLIDEQYPSPAFIIFYFIAHSVIQFFYQSHEWDKTEEEFLQFDKDSSE